MTGLPTQRSAFFDALSSFWRTMFADREILEEVLRASEETIGQAYLDLLYAVLGRSINDTPVWRKEYWHYLELTQANLRKDSDPDYPFYIEVSEQVAQLPLLYNLVINPTVVMEEGADHTMLFGENTLRFASNPFDNARIPRRSRQITPVVYRAGQDARIDTAAAPREVTFDGLLREGIDGQVFSTTQFKAVTGSFTSADIGRTLTVTSAGVAYTRTVDAIVDSTLVGLDSAIPVTATGARWRLLDPELFDSFHEGEVLVIQDPVSLVETAYTIETVTSGLAVTLTEDIALEQAAVAGISWVHKSQDLTTEIALWAPDASLDKRDLAQRYGALLRRVDASTEGYKALLQGIFQYFILGPSIPRIQSALNVFVGVPVVRNTEETITQIDLTDPVSDIVVTDLETYRLPKYSVRSDLSAGDTLRSLEALTEVFQVEDYITDPSWFYGRDIPVELVANASVPDRAIDPRLREVTVGASPAWYVETPCVAVGADDNGALVPERQGRAGFVWDVDGRYILLISPRALREEDLGGVITVNGTSYDILEVIVYGFDARYAFVRIANDLSADFGLNNFSGIADPSGFQIVDFGSPRLTARDEGGFFLVRNSSAPSMVNTVWRIDKLITMQRAEVTLVDVLGAPGATPTLVAGATLDADILFDWEIQTRPPLAHSLGYQLMVRYIQYNSALVSYDFTQYPDVPFLRSTEDIQDVLLEGKPSYVHLFFEGRSSLTDAVGVTDEVELGLQPGYEIVQAESQVTVGSGWNVGDYYFHAWPAATPFEVVYREHEFTTDVVIQNSEKIHEIIFTGIFDSDPTASYTVTVEAFNGVTWGAHPDGVFVLDNAGTNVWRMQTYGLPLRINATEAGTTTKPGILASLRAEGPEVVALSEPLTATGTAGVGAGTDSFVDAAYTFYDFDLMRTLHVDDAGTLYTYRVLSVVSATEVTLTNPDGTAAVVPVGAGYEWYWGCPNQYATPITVGQGPIDITRDDTVSRFHMVDWPVQITYKP